MKLNRTGYWLIALFTALGLVFLLIGLLVGGMVGGILAANGAIWLLVVLGLYLYARQQKGKGEHERWLFENGLRGTGTVVGSSSNTTINDQPVLKLVLDVAIPGQPPRRAEHKLLMSSFAAYRMRPGVVLPVHVNPQNPSDLLVRW
jgi:hypothetical protein